MRGGRLRDCYHRARLYHVTTDPPEEPAHCRSRTRRPDDSIAATAWNWPGRARPGRGPTVVFLPGFRSDMTGEKATMLAAHCAERGPGACCGSTIPATAPAAARFEDGTIGRWTQRRAGRHRARRPRARWCWSAPRWAAGSRCSPRRAPGPRLAGLIGIAAAPDFTENLMWQAMTFEERARADARRRAACAQPVRRALSDHPHADRGRPQPSAAGRADRARLPGAAAAWPARSRRAVGDGAAHRRAGRPPRMSASCWSRTATTACRGRRTSRCYARP